MARWFFGHNCSDGGNAGFPGDVAHCNAGQTFFSHQLEGCLENLDYFFIVFQFHPTKISE